MARQLTPEIWALVMQHLPPADQKTCLSVSSTHHTIAKRFVFSDVPITLRLWTEVRVDDEIHPLHKSVQDEVARRARTSLGLLKHIATTPEFADLVRKLTVRAQGLGDEKRVAFDTDVLVRALSKMRNLRAFIWSGSSPAPTDDVLEALLEASPRTLTHLSLPTAIPRGFSLPPQTQLASFALLDRYAVESGADPPVEDAQRVLTANAPTLRRLCVSSSPQSVSVLYGSDPQAFTRLQELSLVFPRTVDGLDAVFTHCAALRALTFCVDADLGVDEAVTEALRTHPAAFPALASFKLLHRTGFPRGTSPGQDVADFVRDRGAALRRLDVVLGPSALAFYGGCPLMWSLPKLPALEVLGFDWYPAYLVRGLVQFLDINLPRALTALHVYARVGQADMKMADWMDFFGNRDGLRFVNVVCDRGESIFLRDVLFQHPPRALERLGYNFAIRTVAPRRRGRGPEEPAFAEPWSWPKAFYASLDRCGCGGGGAEEGEEDWEWLLRHHGHNDRTDIAEWMLKAEDANDDDTNDDDADDGAEPSQSEEGSESQEPEDSAHGDEERAQAHASMEVER